MNLKQCNNEHPPVLYLDDGSNECPLCNLIYANRILEINLKVTNEMLKEAHDSMRRISITRPKDMWNDEAIRNWYEARKEIYDSKRYTTTMVD